MKGVYETSYLQNNMYFIETTPVLLLLQVMVAGSPLPA